MKILSEPRAKFIVLQVILCAALATLYIQGLLLKPFSGEGAVFSYCVSAASLWSLWLIWRGNYSSAEWYSEKLIRVGIVGLQIGILTAMAAMAERLMMGGDIMQVTGLFLTAMSAGLYVSIIALASNLWLEFTLFVVD